MSEEQPGTSVVPGQTYLPSNIDAMLEQESANIAKRIGSAGGDMIKVTQDKQIVLPSGETIPGPFEAVIVDFVSAHYMYDSVYDPKNPESPICFALNPVAELLAPAASSPQPQAKTCAVCPQNQWGSGGGNSKACKNTRLIALLMLNEDGQITDETPLWTMKLSPTAIKPFGKYASDVSRIFAVDGKPANLMRVISQIGLDPTARFASVRFGKPQPNPFYDIAKMRFPEARQRLLTEPEIRPAEEEKPAPAKPAAPKKR